VNGVSTELVLPNTPIGKIALVMGASFVGHALLAVAFYLQKSPLPPVVTETDTNIKPAPGGGLDIHTETKEKPADDTPTK